MSDAAAEPGAVIRVLVAEDARILRETLVTLFSLDLGSAANRLTGPRSGTTVQVSAVRGAQDHGNA
jgi:hypothetical protein